MLDKIKALCKDKKTSISKLEKQLGFGNGVIGRWDKSVPSYERLAAVANALDVPVAYLTGETDDTSAGIKEEKKLPAQGGEPDKDELVSMVERVTNEATLRAVLNAVNKKFQELE